MTQPRSLYLVLLIALSLLPFRAAAEQPKHLFVLAGQSNMTPAVAQTFRPCVQEVFGPGKTIVAMSARPSQPIKQWYKDWQPPEGLTDPTPEQNGQLYVEMMKKVDRHVKDSKLASVTFVWMQGEADSVEWGSVYEKSFLGVVAQIKEDLGVDKVNFVIGRINDYWLINKKQYPDAALVRKVQQKLGEEHAHGDWIDTDDLNRGVNPWGGYSFDDGHFPPSGYFVMGQRFAKKACLLLDPTLKLDSEVFKEHFIDRADQIKTHLAIGKTTTGPRPTKGAVLSALTDGKYAKADHNEPGWVVFAPSEEPIELVVDLGAVHRIDSVAVNKLLSTAAKSEFPNRFIYSTSKDGKEFSIQHSKYHSVTPYYGRKHLQGPDGKFGPESVLLLTYFHPGRFSKVVDARYVKIQIQTGGHWVFLDEIIVNAAKDFGSDSAE